MSTHVFIGINGNVFCLDRTTGEEIWRAELKGGSFVNLLVDGSLVIATTRGEVFGIDAGTGQKLWHNKMSGQGLGLATIATASGTSSFAAFEKHKQEQQAASSAGTGAAISGG